MSAVSHQDGSTVTGSQPTGTTQYPNGIHHLAFGTRSSKATYEFYHDKLGMPPRGYFHGAGHAVMDQSCRLRYRR